MKYNVKIKLLVLICTVIGVSSYARQADQRHMLWYDKPANNWNKSLPIGNGYIGGMVFGNPGHERIQLNESTIWAGGPNNNIDSEAGKNISKVRALLASKKYVEAQELANRTLGPKGNSGMPYQLAGNLIIDIPAHAAVSNYRRDLDISRAIASVSYTHNSVNYKREYFTSFTQNAMLVRLTADRPKMISCKISLQSPLSFGASVIGDNFVLSGKGSDHENQKGQIKFNVITRVKSSGGTQHTDTSGISIAGADTAVVYLAMATNFINYKDISADALKRAESSLDRA